MFQIDRRLLLTALSAALVPPPLTRALAAVTDQGNSDSGNRLGTPQPFSFQGLIRQAQ
jgi:hypothetical protein